MKTIVVLVSGSGTNLQAIIDACDGGQIPARIGLVVSNRADAYGLVRAEAAGIPTAYHPLRPYREDGRGRTRYDEDLADLVANLQPDAVVLAGWMHILSVAFTARFADRTINLHPALPGTFPGAHAIDDALAAHARGEVIETGVMVHLVPDEGVDVGPVLASEPVPIVEGDDVDTLRARLQAVEHRLLVTALRLFLR